MKRRRRRYEPEERNAKRPGHYGPADCTGGAAAALYGAGHRPGRGRVPVRHRHHRPGRLGHAGRDGAGCPHVLHPAVPFSGPRGGAAGLPAVRRAGLQPLHRLQAAGPGAGQGLRRPAAPVPRQAGGPGPGRPHRPYHLGHRAAGGLLRPHHLPRRHRPHHVGDHGGVHRLLPPPAGNRGRYRLCDRRPGAALPHLPQHRGRGKAVPGRRGGTQRLCAGQPAGPAGDPPVPPGRSASGGAGRTDRRPLGHGAAAEGRRRPGHGPDQYRDPPL